MKYFVAKRGICMNALLKTIFLKSGEEIESIIQFPVDVRCELTFVTFLNKVFKCEFVEVKNKYLEYEAVDKKIEGVKYWVGVIAE
jgi:hypothetical protein